ncbi:MAG TPA: dTMP kinase [Gemmatimonadales bacterium]
MPAGFFLVLEGPEGSGKTTLAAGLADRLRGVRVDPVVVREPGGTPVAEVLRRELLDEDRAWTPEMELLYIVTARADHVTRVIRPALEAGRLVISDRFDLSTRAYQGAGRGVAADFLEAVNHAATGGLTPDLTLILDLPPEVGVARLDENGRAQNRLDQESMDFHRRVAARYLEEQGPGVRHLDASLPPSELLDQAMTALREARPDLLPAT